MGRTEPCNITLTKGVAQRAKRLGINLSFEAEKAIKAAILRNSNDKEYTESRKQPSTVTSVLSAANTPKEGCNG